MLKIVKNSRKIKKFNRNIKRTKINEARTPKITGGDTYDKSLSPCENRINAYGLIKQNKCQDKANMNTSTCKKASLIVWSPAIWKQCDKHLKTLDSKKATEMRSSMDNAYQEFKKGT